MINPFRARTSSRVHLGDRDVDILYMHFCVWCMHNVRVRVCVCLCVCVCVCVCAVASHGPHMEFARLNNCMVSRSTILLLQNALATTKLGSSRQWVPWLTIGTRIVSSLSVLTCSLSLPLPRSLSLHLCLRLPVSLRQCVRVSEYVTVSVTEGSSAKSMHADVVLVLRHVYT